MTTNGSSDNLSSFKRRIIVTGGAGFIGSNLLNLMVRKYPDYLFVNVDKLTYAGNLENLTAVQDLPNYRLEVVDIADAVATSEVAERFDIDAIIHLAAESHVDRSIDGPAPFIQTNVVGTFNLLEIARQKHQQGKSFRFHHVSTDEVFGSLKTDGYFREDSPYRPNSPYSASKAGADHLTRAYHKTYGIDIVTSNCSNNYGPYQFPEKLIPLMIVNARREEKLPVYGDGGNVRDWLFVEDHCLALDRVFHHGRPGGTYVIGGRNEISNLELVKQICRRMDELLGGGPRETLIEFVTDRPGHDRRYAIDPSLIDHELGWKPTVTFDQGVRRTIQWYLDNETWLERCMSGAYRQYYERMYKGR